MHVVHLSHASQHAQLLAAMTHPSRVLNLDMKAKAL